ncbi:MAG: retropepsin-like aspartic protease [Planctomycetota bacterium]
MPSFTSQLPSLQAVGPVVDMTVWVGTPVENALRKAGSPVPQPVPAKGLIDTGATCSVIQPTTVSSLGLQPVGSVNISTPSSANVPCHQYLVRLVFPNNVVVEALAIEAPLQGQQVQCLIGRDVLAHGVFVYTGYINQFTLSF